MGAMRGKGRFLERLGGESGVFMWCVGEGAIALPAFSRVKKSKKYPG